MTENASQLRRKIADLERQLAQVRIEKDDLARDVEALCMETTANTTFSSSSVLRERIFSTAQTHSQAYKSTILTNTNTEKELSKTKSELNTAAGERDSLKEDLREIKEAKRTVEKSYRELNTRLETLERELSFYRQQANQAIADRDNISWECERLKQSNADLAQQIRESTSQAAAATAERELAQRRLEDAENKIEQISLRAAEADQLPRMRADLVRARSTIADLEKQSSTLQEELIVAKREITRVENKAAHAEKVKQDTAQEAKAIGAEAQQQLVEVTRQKVDALIRLSDSEAARTTADREVERLSEQLESTQDQLAQATQEKVRALMLAAELRAHVDDSIVVGAGRGRDSLNGVHEEKKQSCWK